MSMITGFMNFLQGYTWWYLCATLDLCSHATPGAAQDHWGLTLSLPHAKPVLWPFRLAPAHYWNVTRNKMIKLPLRMRFCEGLKKGERRESLACSCTRHRAVRTPSHGHPSVHWVLLPHPAPSTPPLADFSPPDL